MKVLIIHTKYAQLGGEDIVVKYEYELLKEKYEVEILYFQNSRDGKGALQFLLSLWNLFAAIKVRKKIHEFKPDVVHLHNWHFACGPLIIRVIKKIGIPIVHTLHNYRLICPSAILLHSNKIFLNSLNENFPWTAVKNAVYRNSYTQTFWLAFVIWCHKKIGTWNKVDQFVCLTESAKNLFIRSTLSLPENKFAVKPNFISEVHENIQLKRQEHFLFIGRLSEEKGVYSLLEVFKNSQHKLKIAGDGPLKENVMEAARQSPNIVYMGVLSREKIIAELHQSQVLLFPSIWYEGMPMTILEAFATSTPVIASDLGAMSCMIVNGENGFRFEAGDSESLKNAINRFSTLTEEEKKQMQQNAFTTYQTLYSVEKQMTYFEGIYNKAILSNEK